MSPKHCKLCALEVPDPPVTDNNTEGVFCCHGCLHVYKLLQDMDEDQAEKLRQETIALRKGESEQSELPENYSEAFLKVNGMHCSTCETFVEALASREAGVYKSEASYASEMVKVYYDENKLEIDELPGKLSRMGYTVQDIEADSDKEHLNEVARLVIGGFFGIMGLLLYGLFLYPVYINGEGFTPLTFEEQLFFISNIWVMTTFVFIYTGFPILRGAWVSLSVGKPNMDLLITIAAASAYLYSIGAAVTGSLEVYFDVTMAIILVVSIGNYYEKKVKSNKQDLLTKLTKKKSTTARVRRNGHFINTSPDEIKPGDQVLVKAGERIPIDGKIIDGNGVVNEALITGESIPVTKKVGDNVLSGTILTQNAITIKVGEDVESTVDNLLHLMWNIQSSKPGSQRLVDRIAAFFIPAVIVLATVTFGFHLYNGLTATNAMLSALAVLIVSCPCALGLATPLAIASGIKNALEHNIILKSNALFERKADVDVIAFDKTGTLTTGKMHLLDDGNNQNALRYASLLEQYSSHPIAEPIAAASSSNSTKVENFESYSTGVKGVINGITVFTGQPEWLMDEKGFSISQSDKQKINQYRESGNIPVAVAWDDRIQSILEVGDQLRDEARGVISNIKKRNKKVAMITGDHDRAARKIQKTLQTNFLFSEVKPKDKSKIINELKNIGIVAMVGDGSNDAPALAEADLGIAFGNPTAIATESAHIVVPNEQLDLIPASFQLIEQTKLRIKQNLGWAFLYNIITIPLAIAGMINPLFAAVAMATSSLLVVGNSSRSMNYK